MAQITYVDELIREYLLYRCFNNTLKVFETELKLDKDKGFRVDKIVDQLMSFINNYDLVSLRDLWSHFDQKMFSKLEHHFIPALRKIENAILKMYLVNCINNNKSEKVTEFFSKLTPELHGQPEWKEWFILPFTSRPEENPAFSIHFTKQWQDTLWLSLHNLLATAVQCLPQPALLTLEADATKLQRLAEENEALKHRLAAIADPTAPSYNPDPRALDLTQPDELMDDFYIIAQENIGSEVHSKSLKNLIRNIGSGLPTSPILGRKPGGSGASKVNVKSASVDDHSTTVTSPYLVSSSSSSSHRRTSSTRQRATSSGPWPSKAASVDSGGTGTHQSRRASSQVRVPPPPPPPPSPPPSTGTEATLIPSKTPHLTITDSDTNNENENVSSYILLSQEEYSEHRSSIIQCKFNPSGSAVASSDNDGNIKIWTAPPNAKTCATFPNKSSVLSLDWVSKNERYLIAGTKLGSVRLYDTREPRLVWELGADTINSLRDTRIVHICSNPTDSNFVCSADANHGAGKLLLFDIKTKSLERTFNLGPTANACAFNHNGQLLLAGCHDGAVRLFDLRAPECIDTWKLHQGALLSLALAADDTLCFTLGQDAKICRRSVHQPSLMQWEALLPNCPPLYNASTLHGQLFAFDSSGQHALIGGPAGASLYHLADDSLVKLLDLAGHRSPVLALDWAIANQSATCLTAAGDGGIKISTLLTP